MIRDYNPDYPLFREFVLRDDLTIHKVVYKATDVECIEIDCVSTKSMNLSRVNILFKNNKTITLTFNKKEEAELEYKKSNSWWSYWNSLNI